MILGLFCFVGFSNNKYNPDAGLEKTVQKESLGHANTFVEKVTFCFLPEKFELKVKKNKAISFVIPVYTATSLEDGSEYNEMAKEVEEWFKYYNSKPKEETLAPAGVLEEVDEQPTQQGEDAPW